MTPRDRPEFARMMIAVGEVFDTAVSELRAEAYFDALSEFDLDVVLAAARHAIKHNKFFPRAAELREIIEGGAADSLAMQAWMALTNAIPRVGAYAALLARDPAWAGAVRDAFGGWPEAVKARGELEEPSWQAKRKEFVVAYLRHRRMPALVGLSYLTGLSDRANASSIPAAWPAETRASLSRRLVWLLDRNWNLSSLMAPYDERGQPQLAEVERVLLLPPDQRAPRRLVAAIPDPPPVSKEEFERQLAEALARVRERILAAEQGEVEP